MRTIGRRTFLWGLAHAPAVSATRWRDRLLNPCGAALPERLARHEIVRAAWDGLDPAHVWDCHVHLAGTGDSGQGPRGPWMSPKMQSWLHPVEYVRRLLMLNAACVDRRAADRTYVERLHAIMSAFPAGAKAVVLAFDFHHDDRGRPDPARSSFQVPNAYAADVARRRPDRFEWVASIHPYREDMPEALAAAVRDGARAIKWLPNAMGIDPASPRCDPFYEALVRHRLPLLSHGGEEAAVPDRAAQQLGNPLRLRRALDHGVQVIVAHCASLGAGVDLDRGPSGPPRPNVELFGRLMDEPRYERLVYGDISAVTQINRTAIAFPLLLERQEWHPRLLYGSDYPLPGVMPLISPRRLAAAGFLPRGEVAVLDEIQGYNPLLFDFVLKRRLAAGGKRFAAAVFRTRLVFAPRPPA